VNALCARYGVTRSGFYSWRRRCLSAHDRQDERLLARIRAIFEASEGTYGSPRVHTALKNAGLHRARKRVARLMQEGGLKARVARIYRRTVGTRMFFMGIPNRVLDLETTAPDQIWVGDITYLRCGNEWRYLAAVMDRHSRRIVGWSLQRTRELGDNAFIESFFHSMKADAIHARTFDDDSQLRATLDSYIRRYNRSRLHSSIGYRSPIDYERSSV
jgi:putative transposase